MTNPQRVLFIDLETSPQKGYFFGSKWETNIIEIAEQALILSYSASWLHGGHITRGWPDYKGYRQGKLDDKKLVKDLWKLFDEADIIVGQNSKSFDTKVANARFVYHGLTPPSPYKQVDTKAESKKYLRLPSNSLDDVCDYFGIGRKVEHEGKNLWFKCMAGDLDAWDRMKRYNRNDVVLTEHLYKKLLPWMTNHPVMAEKPACPKCSMKALIKQGTRKYLNHVNQIFVCKNCGGWTTERV